MAKRIKLSDVLAAIETIVGDDFCEDLDMRNADRKLRGRIAKAHDKLSRIYRLAHSFNETHSCHHIHADWRKEIRDYGTKGETKFVLVGLYGETPASGEKPRDTRGRRTVTESHAAGEGVKK